MGSYLFSFNAEPLERSDQSFHFLDLGEVRWEKRVLLIALIKTIVSKPPDGRLALNSGTIVLATFPMNVTHSWLSEAGSVM